MKYNPHNRPHPLTLDFSKKVPASERKDLWQRAWRNYRAFRIRGNEHSEIAQWDLAGISGDEETRRAIGREIRRGLDAASVVDYHLATIFFRGHGPFFDRQAPRWMRTVILTSDDLSMRLDGDRSRGEIRVTATVKLLQDTEITVSPVRAGP